MKGMVYLQNIIEKDVETIDELEKQLSAGIKRRATAATDMNAHSSRSHLIFSILIKTKNLQTETKSEGKVREQIFQLTDPQLTLVDLAGSERVSKSGATADRLKVKQLAWCELTFPLGSQIDQ